MAQSEIMLFRAASILFLAKLEALFLSSCGPVNLLSKRYLKYDKLVLWYQFAMPKT